MLICIVPVCVPGIQFFERCAENSEGAQWLIPFSVLLDNFPAVGFSHMLYFCCLMPVLRVYCMTISMSCMFEPCSG